MNKIIWFGFLIFLCWFFWNATLLQASLGVNVLFIIYFINVFYQVIRDNYINKDEETDNGTEGKD